MDISQKEQLDLLLGVDNNGVEKKMALKHISKHIEVNYQSILSHLKMIWAAPDLKDLDYPEAQMVYCFYNKI
jgi:hypothetical protein